MFEGYYAERVVRDRAHERARDLALTGGSRTASPGEERAVLATDWRGWSWRRAASSRCKSKKVPGTLWLRFLEPYKCWAQQRF